MRSVPLLLSLLCLFATLAGQKPAAQIYSDNREAVVVVKTEKKVGSGFFVSRDGLIVTNHHVVEDDLRPTVKLSNGIELPSQTIGSNPALDIAILQVNGIGFKHVRLSGSHSVATGTPIVVISNPLGLEGSIAEGLVSAIREFGPVGKLLQISAPVSPGSSGGLVCDLRGNALGMVSATMQEGQNLNFAIPSSAVLEALDNLKKPGPDLVSDDRGPDSEKVQKIQRYLDSGMFEQAVNEATDHLKADEFNPTIRFLLAEALVKLELYDEAIRHLRIVRKLDPTYWEATSALANAHLLRWKRIGNVKDRVAACELYHELEQSERVNTLDPNLPEDVRMREARRVIEALKAHLILNREMESPLGKWTSEDDLIYEITSKESWWLSENRTLGLFKKSTGLVEGMPVFLKLFEDRESGVFKGESTYRVGDCRISTLFGVSISEHATKITVIGVAIQEGGEPRYFRDVCRERYPNGSPFLKFDLIRIP